MIKTNKKRKLAMKMMTQEEITNHVSPYSSRVWLIRTKARRLKENAKRVKTKTNLLI